MFAVLSCSQVPAWGAATLSPSRSPACVLFLAVAENRDLQNKRAGSAYRSVSPIHLLHLQAPVTSDFPEAEAVSLYLATFSWVLFLESIQFILLTHLFLWPTVSRAETFSSIASVRVATCFLDCFDLAIRSYSLSLLLGKSMANAFFATFSMSLAFVDLQKPAWIWKCLFIQTAYPDGEVRAYDQCEPEPAKPDSPADHRSWLLCQVLIPCSYPVDGFLFCFVLAVLGCTVELLWLCKTSLCPV